MPSNKLCASAGRQAPYASLSLHATHHDVDGPHIKRCEEDLYRVKAPKLYCIMRILSRQRGVDVF
jgi:hypothetical protein